MRKKFASPSRLLSLLLMQILVALAVPHVAGSSAKSKSREGTQNRHNIIASEPFVRTYQLQSRRNNRFVGMGSSKKDINATASMGAPFARLDFVSHRSGAIKIKSKAFSRYLCFNRKGILSSRDLGRSDNCLFKEVPYLGYVKFQSKANPDWYVGFNKNGRKLKGYAKQDTFMKEKCFMFTKVQWPRPKVRHDHHFGISLGQLSQSIR